MGSFATDIFQAKYAHTKEDGTKETWQEIAKRAWKKAATGVQLSRMELEAFWKDFWDHDPWDHDPGEKKKKKKLPHCIKCECGKEYGDEPAHSFWCPRYIEED